WIEKHGAEYERVDYNVRLGNGTDPGPEFTDSQREEYKLNTQKRADAILWNGDQATIAEVKDRATASSMSQLLTYKALFPIQFPVPRLPKLLLVKNRFSADMKIVLKQVGIDFSIVEPDFSGLSNRPATP